MLISASLLQYYSLTSKMMCATLMTQQISYDLVAQFKVKVNYPGKAQQRLQLNLRKIIST